MSTAKDLKIFLSNRKYWLSILIAFFIGFFVSPYIYPKLFGYSSAEECAIHAKTKWAIGFCFDLYPEVKK
ncbi:hypothetical protein [Zwartia sp.]|uniref:hypothetical protein n=1 Tax=Zwartia sp. TaxID=2978004 RepID=UPI003BAF4AA4